MSNKSVRIDADVAECIPLIQAAIQEVTGYTLTKTQIANAAIRDYHVRALKEREAHRLSQGLPVAADPTSLAAPLPLPRQQFKSAPKPR